MLEDAGSGREEDGLNLSEEKTGGDRVRRRQWSFQPVGRLVAAEDRNPKKGNERRPKISATVWCRRWATNIYRRRARWLEGVRPKIATPRKQTRRVTTCKVYQSVKCVLYGPYKVTEIPSRCLAQWEKAGLCVVKWNCYGLIKGAWRDWKRGDGMEVEFLHTQPKSGFSIYLQFSFTFGIWVLIDVGPSLGRLKPQQL
jgi:hypothetical protein